MKGLMPLALVSFLVLAGCAYEPPGDDVQLAPRVGSWGMYENANGIQLLVAVGDLQPVRDPWGHLRAAVEITYDFSLVKEGRSERLEVREYVDAATGLHVRHESPCVFKPSDGCGGDYTNVYFGAFGYPGAMGMGPRWATGLDTRSSTPMGARGFQTEGPGAVDWDPLEQPDCWQRTPGREEPWSPVTAWLPVTSVSQPSIWCSHTPFPLRLVMDMGFPLNFATTDSVEFQLKEWSLGTGEAWPAADGTPLAPTPPPEPKDADPTGLVVNEGPRVAFTSEEGHDVLLMRSQHYRAAMERGAHVIATSYTQNQSGIGGGGPSLKEVHERKFVILEDGGKPMMHVIRKETHPVLKPDVPTYEILPERQWPYAPGPQPVPSPSLDLQRAMGLTHNLVACSPLLGIHFDTRVDQGAVRGTWEGRAHDRVIVRVSHWPPGNQPMVFQSLQVRFDGLTRAPLELGLPMELLNRYDAAEWSPDATCS